MKMKCILVDDEQSSRDVIKVLLEQYCPDVDIIAEASDAITAYELIQKKKPNFIFLDINMPVENGFSLLKKFTNISFEIIFVTSYDQFALQAIKFSALDYIVKPIEIDELINAIDKLKLRLSQKMSTGQYVHNLLNNQTSSLYDKHIVVHVNSKARLVRLREIVCIESNINYSYLILENNEQLITTKTLKDFEELFDIAPMFVRINRGAIVNIFAIKEYSKNDPYYLVLNNGREYEISRRKKQEVLERVSELKL